MVSDCYVTRFSSQYECGGISQPLPVSPRMRVDLIAWEILSPRFLCCTPWLLSRMERWGASGDAGVEQHGGLYPCFSVSPWEVKEKTDELMNVCIWYYYYYYYVMFFCLVCLGDKGHGPQQVSVFNPESKRRKGPDASLFLQLGSANIFLLYVGFIL